MKIRPVLFYAPLCALTIAGCRQAPPPETKKPATENIRVATIHSESSAGALSLPGRVEAVPEHIVHIYAPLSGRLLNMSLSPGQEVRKGQKVAELQSGDVAQARSDFEKAKIEVLRADRALDRGKTLAAHEVMSQADLQELEAVDAAAHAEQERARQRVRELGFSENGNSDITAIVSPITGTVLDIGSASGEMQRSLETSNGIATIANLDTVWVTGDIFERDLGLVHPHDAVSITLNAYPGETLHGTIANIGDSMDPATHAVKVRVVMANPGHRLKPQMFATLSISQPAQTRLMVPQTAVLHEGDGTAVYVPVAGGKYNLHSVVTGRVVGDRIEVVSGLKDGDQIVVQGAAFLRQPVGD